MRIQDVAKKANVGVGTVSRVLNNNGYVSDKTRKRVEKAIQELQYTPNELARNLFRNRTNTIAVIVPDIANPFYGSLVNEIEKNLRMREYKTMLCNTVGEQTNEEVYLQMLQRNMVDGILTCTHTLDNSRYADITGAVVSFDTPPLSESSPVVTVDHKAGGRMAAELLLGCGCRHIVQFHDNFLKNFPFFDRHIEFERIVRAAGVECHSFILEQDCFTEEFFAKSVDECFEKYPDTDGVFATDMLASCYMKKAMKAGMKIPEEVSIVSYDGTYLKDFIFPTLTCIKQPVREIAETGVNLLMGMIHGERPVNKKIILPVRLEMGMTTLNKTD